MESIRALSWLLIHRNSLHPQMEGQNTAAGISESNPTRVDSCPCDVLSIQHCLTDNESMFLTIFVITYCLTEGSCRAVGLYRPARPFREIHVHILCVYIHNMARISLALL